MTGEQFERWRDFALRMVRLHPARARMPSRRWVMARVDDFVSQFANDHAWIVDWDKSREIENPRSSSYRDRFAHGIGDLMSLYEWDWLPCRVQQLEHDEKDDEFEEQRDRWFQHVRCCVRAGLDVASEPSAGVVGFTIGNLRSMYPEGIPDWLATGWVDPAGADVGGDAFRALADTEGVWL